mmetsp:Transcript_114596/g.335108  ORF Transcript_114596/g.335108 Transcript_114596/m.335108 type:complete len:207 (-) Transcript_114596:120-740(-)
MRAAPEQHAAVLLVHGVGEGEPHRHPAPRRSQPRVRGVLVLREEAPAAGGLDVQIAGPEEEVARAQRGLHRVEDGRVAHQPAREGQVEVHLEPRIAADLAAGAAARREGVQLCERGRRLGRRQHVQGTDVAVLGKLLRHGALLCSMWRIWRRGRVVSRACGAVRRSHVALAAAAAKHGGPAQKSWAWVCCWWTRSPVAGTTPQRGC